MKDLVSWYESKGIGYVDMLTEEYADKHGDIRLGTHSECDTACW
jgi:hypothetical protein